MPVVNGQWVSSDPSADNYTTSDRGANKGGGIGSWLSDMFGTHNPYEDDSLTRNTPGYSYGGTTEGQFGAMANDAGNRGGPNVDASEANRGWGQEGVHSALQDQSLSDLANAAQGNSPSVAQIQMQQGIMGAQAAQQSMASGARGGPGAWMAAQRQASNQMAGLQQNSINDSAALRANEMATARGQYSNALQGARGADIQHAGQGWQQGMNQAQLFLQNRGQNDQMQQALLKMGQGSSMANQQGQLDYNNLVTGVAAQNAQSNGNASAAGMGMTAAALAAMSDYRLKQDIRGIGESPYVPASTRDSVGGSSTHDTETQDMLRKIQPVEYEYKAMPGRKQYGVIAQDLEKSNMGSSLIRNTPAGKMIDPNHASHVALAALADVNARLERIEGRRR